MPLARFLILIAIIASGSTPAISDECGTRLHLTKSLVKNITSFSGYSGSSKVPAFLLGHISDNAEGEFSNIRGTVAFIKRGAKWRALQPVPFEQEQATFVSAAGQVFIFTMIATEGPGPAWTLYRSSNGLKSAKCIGIDFPPAVKQGSYLELVDFNLDQKGKGKVVGTGEADSGKGPETSWYEYSTDDGGKSWSDAVRLPGKPAALIGVFSRVAKDNIPSLQHDLETHVGLH